MERYTEIKEKHKSLFTTDDIRRIILCVAAGTIMSLNLRSFVHTGGLFPGGIAGLTVLIRDIFIKYLDMDIPYGRLYLLLNVLPFLLAIRKIGRKFTIYSGVTIALVAFLTEIIPVYTFTYDKLLIGIFGGIINGASIALTLMAGATSGGTDFIAIFLSESFSVDGFTYVLGFNAVMLSIAGLIFGWDRALYSIIFQYASTQVIHALNKRYKKNTLFIVTDYPREVVSCLNSAVRHGVTEMDVIGTYKDTKRSMIYSVISNPELKLVLRGLHNVDPHAFVNVIRTEQVSGRFYMKPND